LPLGAISLRASASLRNFYARHFWLIIEAMRGERRIAHRRFISLLSSPQSRDAEKASEILAIRFMFSAVLHDATPVCQFRFISFFAYAASGALRLRRFRPAPRLQSAMMMLHFVALDYRHYRMPAYFTSTRHFAILAIYAPLALLRLTR